MKKTLVVILLAFIWRLFFFFPGIVLEGSVNKNLTGTGIVQGNNAHEKIKIFLY